MSHRRRFAGKEDWLRRTVSYDPLTGVFRYTRDLQKYQAGDVINRAKAKGYLCVSALRDKKISLHRVAFLLMTGEWPKGVVDHVNGDRLDNRWENLRDVTPEQNQANTPHGTASRRFLRYGGKFIPILAAYDTFEEAEEAAIRAELLA